MCGCVYVSVNNSSMKSAFDRFSRKLIAMVEMQIELRRVRERVLVNPSRIVVAFTQHLIRDIFLINLYG